MYQSAPMSPLFIPQSDTLKPCCIYFVNCWEEREWPFVERELFKNYLIPTICEHQQHSTQQSLISMRV